MTNGTELRNMDLRSNDIDDEIMLCPSSQETLICLHM